MRDQRAVEHETRRRLMSRIPSSRDGMLPVGGASDTALHQCVDASKALMPHGRGFALMLAGHVGVTMVFSPRTSGFLYSLARSHRLTRAQKQGVAAR